MAQKKQPRDDLPVESYIVTPEIVEGAGEIVHQLLIAIRSIGLEPTYWELDALLSGAVVNFGVGHVFKLVNNRLLIM